MSHRKCTNFDGTMMLSTAYSRQFLDATVTALALIAYRSTPTAHQYKRGLIKMQGNATLWLGVVTQRFVQFKKVLLTAQRLPFIAR